MLRARMRLVVLVSSAALLHVRAGAAAEGRRTGRMPLRLYTSESCNEIGVNYAYYEGNFGNLVFDKAKPVKTGKLRQIDLSPRKRNEHYGIKFTGYLKARAAGVFEFFVRSDNRSRLYIGSKTVVKDGQGHHRGEIRLAEGVHPVTLTYQQGGGGWHLEIWCRMPLPWDVDEAEIRVPVGVSLEPAWARMPPHAYLADLDPMETQGLTFDRKTKSAALRDVRSKEDKERIIAKLKERCRRNNQEYKPEFYRLHGRPIMRVRGSATFRLKPEYRWFSYRPHGHTEIHIDGHRASGVRGGRDGMHPHDHRFPTYKQEWATIVPIPPGRKKFTIKADAEWIRQPGFLARGPAVARVAFCLSGRDPTSLIPLVYDSLGERVGCRILWAHPGEPMAILFDCSSGERSYLVYLVDRSKNPARLKWAPKAGLILESRYPSRYDPAVGTVDGFLELWDAADSIAGKKEMARIWKAFFPFRPPVAAAPNYRDVLRGERIGLSCYTGFFHAPGTQKYQFHYKAEPAGYFLIDNQLVSQVGYRESEELERKGSREGYKRFAVELEKGIHRMEFCQYGSAGRFSTRLGWGLPGNESDLEPFGNNHHSAAFSVWEPVADAGEHPVSHRDKDLFASFTWHHRHQWWGKYPARDIILYSFSARLPEKPGGAVFRWRFDDGRTVEGERVDHSFLSPGTRKVELDVLDGRGGKVIASVRGKVHVHMNWSWPDDAGRGHIMHLIRRRAEEFASVTPIEEVIGLYYWSRQNHWPKLRKIIGSALTKRADDVIKKYPYTRLLGMAQSLGAPREARYDVAERFLKAVMDRAPAGGRHWRSAALALAEILVAAHAKLEEGLALLEELQKTAPTVGMTGGWQTAEAKRWHFLTATGNIAGVPGGLNWTNTALPLEVRSRDGRGMWLAKDIDLPASRKGKELVLDLGGMPGSGVIWFNGKRVGRPWQWPDGSIVVPAGVQRAGGKNRFAALFQPTDPPGHFTRTSAPAFSPDLKRVAWGSRGHTIKLQDAGTGKVLRTLRGHSLPVQSIAFSPDGRRLVSGSYDRTVKVWDTGNWKELRALKGHSGGVLSVAFSRDGKRLASGSRDSTIKLWDSGSWKELCTLKGHSRRAHSVALSPDGGRLASGNRDNTITLWDTASGKELRTLKGHSGPVNCVAFSPDGKLLASGSHDRHVRLWDTGNWKELRALGGHSGEVLSIAFSPDGKRLISGSHDRHIRLWDPARGNTVRVLHGHGDYIFAVAFSSDGKRLATAERYFVKIWNAANGHELRKFAGHGSREFSVSLRVSGPPKGRAEEGYSFPMALYASTACTEKGVNYAYYEGKWDRLPDFDAMEPVKTGRLEHVDLSPRKRNEYFGMKFTGYVKVMSAGDYEFGVRSDNGSRLCIDSKTVVDNNGNDTYNTRGRIHLTEGVHAVTLTFFQSHAACGLNLALPNTSLTAEEVAIKRMTADALLGMGRNKEAAAILMNLKPDAWPIPEKTRLKLTSDLRKMVTLRSPTDTDTSAVMDTVNSWLHKHPMLRTDPEFMGMKIEAYVEMGDYARAFTLAKQMRRADMSDHKRRQLMLVQVKSMIKAGQMKAAREVYGELKKIAPYSTATVEAREAIKEAILKE